MSEIPIEVVRSRRRKKTLSASLVDGTVRVLVPAGMPADQERRLVDALVTRVTRKMRAGEIDLSARALQLAAKYGLPHPESIEWSDRQNTRWGSCTSSSGRVRISIRLVQVPGWVLDFVIVHELAHLEEANHGPRFKELVGRYELSERATGYLLALNQPTQA
jgi:hypothetical protein